MYRYIRLKRIKVNGKRCEASTRLHENDLVTLYISDEFFLKTKKQPQFMLASKTLTIVYEDANIAILYKPAGVLVHDDSAEFSDTLINRFLRYLYEKGEYDQNDKQSFTPALCNRLDRGTAGIVIAAKKRNALAEMNRIIKDRFVKKNYLCITVEKPPKDGTYTAFLKKDERKMMVHISDKPETGYKKIITSIKTKEQRNGLWLLDIDLITGRTHQIRAHLKHLGCPVLGDGKYGDGQINKKYGLKRQALCCYKVTFNLDGDFETLSYLQGKSFSIDDVWFKDEFFK